MMMMLMRKTIMKALQNTPTTTMHLVRTPPPACRLLADRERRNTDRDLRPKGWKKPGQRDGAAKTGGQMDKRKQKCLTSTVGEQTKVTIEYNAFALFNLEDVHISVPSEEAPLDTPNKEVGSCWYDPGKAKEQSKLHWKITAIDEAKRHGSIKFLVPGAVDVSQFFPISVTAKASSTYTNLQLTVLPSKKHSVPPEFEHQGTLEIDYTIYG